MPKPTSGVVGAKVVDGRPPGTSPRACFAGHDVEGQHQRGLVLDEFASGELAVVAAFVAQ